MSEIPDQLRPNPRQKPPVRAGLETGAPGPTQVNLGCGSVTPAGWINVDYALGARLARLPVVGSAAHRLGLFRLRWDRRILIHNLARPLPWPDQSVDVVYCSHTLEHFDRSGGEALLRESFRVLRVGGIIRIVVPDLAAHVRRYLAGTVPAEYFLEDLDVLYGAAKSGLKRALAPLIEYPHRCMYDEEALVRAMRFSGFECRSRAGLDSAIDGIEAVELLERTVDAVIVEGRRPSVWASTASQA